MKVNSRGKRHSNESYLHAQYNQLKRIYRLLLVIAVISAYSLYLVQNNQGEDSSICTETEGNSDVR